MNDRIYNFSAGPATLPAPALKRVQQAVWSYEDSGIGVLEHSHRSRPISTLFEETEAALRRIARIPDDFAVLFLQGGASSQFFMVPMNLLQQDATADYLDTGSWSQKAIKEAKHFGTAHVAASSTDKNYSYIPAPEAIRYSPNPAYIHYTSNNTIFGTEWADVPAAPEGVPVICDASSDILSRPLDLSRLDLVYAGAQKNLGPAGLTLVLVRRDLAASAKRELPTMLQYRTHIEHGSRYNTPPVFALCVLREVLRWMEDRGGLAAIAEQNRTKAQLLYDYLDQSRFFRATARPDSRSRMNVCFRAPSETLESRFVKEAERAGLSGLKGHRSVGGMRASIYNAFPPAGCERLVAFMRQFVRDHSN
ncbi:MAG: 3-phosphoserine/phosphohydroxythreonine transaminase [Proteobacteria bacterium]|nr:3-phosphoserine/phosphohydroxythreonine transaminase [Pseudomonadota bacterium]